MQKCLWTIIYFIISNSWILAQTSNYPVNFFRSPVDTTITLAGNFGEIRPNHFHAGFDIKTNGKEGMPVYAVADGYISRIKISPYGYGKALYITHANGYTSVYGHLKIFEDSIQKFTKKVQYPLELVEIDTLLGPTVLPVKKGQLIGLSGNTGSSGGPHLHFEIRETATEKPINPYYFGYKIDDTIKPKITEVAIYPLSENSTINGKHISKKIKTISNKGKYSINKIDSLTVFGDIGFGIETYDTETKSNSPNGVYSIELQSGGKRIYYHELEKFSFENARYVNAHIDYAEKQKHNVNIQKCFLSKNNQLEIYKKVLNNGVLNFSDDSIHWIKFIVKDFVGNTSELMLKVKSTSENKISELKTVVNTNVFDCKKENKFTNDDIKIVIPPNALYDDIVFSYTKSPIVKSTLSPLYKVMTDETALQKSYSLSIKPIHLPEALQSKACIIRIDDKGKHNYEGGVCTDGFVTTQTKSFGDFAISIDTITPKLKPAFKYIPKTTVDLSKAKSIGIIATDNLSGIKKYRATIDGKWVACEYEFKKDLLFYTFDEHVQPGLHTFTIEVTDAKENKSLWTCTFKR
jgi:murein DD-endopeptidase MepM/ murein hydrolase activator NlpD